MAFLFVGHSERFAFVAARIILYQLADGGAGCKFPGGLLILFVSDGNYLLRFAIACWRSVVGGRPFRCNCGRESAAEVGRVSPTIVSAKCRNTGYHPGRLTSGLERMAEADR